MHSLNPIEDLFRGRHFDRQIIILCVSWYTSFQAELAGSGDHDGIFEIAAMRSGLGSMSSRGAR